jgi:sigma-E factor negative regulatory protein RseB
MALALLVATAAQAGDREAREWLERMSKSLATRNY